MAKPYPTAERVRELLIYDPETGLFTRRIPRGGEPAGAVCGTLMRGYIRIGIDGGIYPAHRLAYLYMLGEIPPAMVDHRHRNTADNRWSEIRPATRSENSRNQKITDRNTSGFKGVSWHKRDKRWRAYICVDGKDQHLGYFDAAGLAHAAYRAAAIRLHGEFANFGGNDNSPSASHSPVGTGVGIDKPAMP